MPTTYYVATTGNNANPGSSGSPWLTLSYAAANVSAGDTVIVRDGTYGNEGQVAPNYVVTMTASGSAGNLITFRAENRGGAILDSGNTTTDDTCDGAAAYFNLASTSYIVIQGFKIKRACDEGIHSNDSAHHITIKWNEIYQIAQRAITDSYGRDGIFLNATQTDFTFDGNLWHDIGRTSGSTSLDHGIYSKATRVTIVNNIFYGFTAGWPIQLADGATTTNIVNNTFYGTNPGQDGQIMLWDTNTDVNIRNNIFHSPANYAITRYTSTLSGCNIDHNIVYSVSSMIASTTGCTVADNQLGVNPLLVSPTSDFRLQAGSPAINAGVTYAPAALDYNGVARTATYDLGAYEYGVSMAELAPHDLTSNYSHQTYYVYASSFFATLPPWKAFDGGTTYWIGTGSGVDWLTLDLGIGAKATLSSYQIQVNTVPEPNRAPKDFTMQGSNDNSAWTTVDTQTSQTGWTSGQTRTFTLGSTSAAYRYFRLNITANNGDATYTQVAELYLIGTVVTAQSADFAPHNMSSNSAPAPYVASASSANGGDPAFHAFLLPAGSGDRWVGTGGGVDYLEIDLGAGVADSLLGYEVYFVDAGTTRAPKNWTLQGSANGSAWNTVDTRTNETSWATTDLRSYTCSTTGTGYRYFRINITANNGDATYTVVTQLYLYGTTGTSGGGGVGGFNLSSQLGNLKAVRIH